MKHVYCDLCNADDYIVIEVIGQCGHPVTNVCCKRCGFVYANPVMDEKERLAFYSSDYYTGHRNILDEKSLKFFLEEERMTAGDRYAHIHTCMHTTSNILEIGCASGALLEILRGKGHSVRGIEPSEQLAEVCKNKGINVYKGLFEDFNSKDELYDVIIMFHVLEHFESPMLVMKKIKGILKQGGKVIFEVPDIWQMWGDPHTGEDYAFTEAHPVTFSEKTLKILSMKTGFTMNPLPRINLKNILVEFTSDKDPLINVDYTAFRDDYIHIFNNVAGYRANYGWKQRLLKAQRIREVERVINRIIGERGRQGLVRLFKKTGIVKLIQKAQ